MNERNIWMKHIEREAFRMRWEIPEELKHYFCDLMVCSVRSQDWVNFYALCDFWKLQHANSRSSDKWRSLGDSCLLTAGFFFDALGNNSASVDVYKKIGRASYRQAMALNIASNVLLKQVVFSYDDLMRLSRGMREPYWRSGN